MHRLQSSERLTSIQCERLDHCRHDCCLLETEEPTGAAASQGEREREREVGSGWERIRLSPSISVTWCCYQLFCALCAAVLRS